MSPDHFDLRRCTGALSTSFSSRLGAGASQEYQLRFDIGVVEWRVLCHLTVEPWSNVIAMANSIGLNKSSVSRSLAGMERRGLVEMRDGLRRRREAALTDEGMALHRAVLPVARARERALLSDFSPEEVKQLLGFFHRLIDNLPRIEEDALIRDTADQAPSSEASAAARSRRSS
ncbi:MarR family transcriptional regulator [Sinirhodobacter populi]|uniref:MarR family transcriptional regulator n=1 Tax=Paenirhodobacter populi TaxID=2306993 RepID=A0A443KDG6_9RHOB|nr:MarR family transcriptional regulator [Sinirhodobacter populi]RWR30838.1 MarR family transcriptional regulator [Sinirhodobacter populi]